MRDNQITQILKVSITRLVKSIVSPLYNLEIFMVKRKSNRQVYERFLMFQLFQGGKGTSYHGTFIWEHLKNAKL